MCQDLLPFSEAKRAIDGWISDLMNLSGCTRKVVLLTKGGECFRTYLATLKKYKGNRDAMIKPEYYAKLREYLITKHKAKVYKKWEADDTARMVYVKADAKPDTWPVIANIDKDLEQIAGNHLNPNHKDWGVYNMSEEEGWYNFYIQMLMGDTADNIGGLKGVGKKKAEAMLVDCHTPEEMCARVYIEYVKVYGDMHTYTPWWWEEQYDEESDPIVVAQRKQHPDKLRFVTTAQVFRENADLLYMLESPTDCYQPQCEALTKLMKPYPKGVVSQFLTEIT